MPELDATSFQEARFLVLLFNILVFSIVGFIQLKGFVVLYYFGGVFLISCFWHLFE